MKFHNWKHYLMAGAFIFSAKLGTTEAMMMAGVKSTGMAGACTAYPIDCFAGAYNPAGMTLLCDRFDLGASTTRYAQRTTFVDYVIPAFVSLNGSRNGARTSGSYTGEFGINKEFSFCAFNNDVELTVGVIGYNQDYIKTTYKQPFPTFGTTNLGLEYRHDVISPIIALRFWERHSLGISFNYHFQRLKINGLENFATPAFSVDPDNVTNNGYSNSQGFGVTLGYLWEVNESIRAGVAWQPEQHMQKFKKYSGFIANDGEFNIPQHFQFGLSYAFTPCLVFAGDWEFIKWKKVPMLDNDGTFFTSLLGSANGPGFGWKNQYVWKFGVDYAINQNFNVRVGFRHVNTPIKGHYTYINQLTLDCVENLITCGASWSPNILDEFSFYYVCGMKKKVQGKNSIPAGFGGTQTTTNSTDANVKQSLFSVGLSWGRKF